MLNIIWISYICFASRLKVNNLSPLGLITFLLNIKIVAFPPVWSLLEVRQTSTLLFVGYLRLIQERSVQGKAEGWKGYHDLFIPLLCCGSSGVLSLGYIIRTSFTSSDLRHPVGLVTNWTKFPRKALSPVCNVLIKKLSHSEFWLGQV